MNRIVLFLCLLFGTVLADKGIIKRDDIGNVDTNEEISLCGSGMNLKDSRYDNSSGYDIEMDGKPVRFVRDSSGKLTKIVYPTYEYPYKINVEVEVIIVKGDKEAVNSLTDDSVNVWIKQLNNIFNARGGIYFNLKRVTRTTNTEISNNFDILADPLKLNLKQPLKTLIIVVAYELSNGYGGTAIFPWAKQKVDAVYISAKYLPPAITSVALLAHEVGHWFGLHHTFHNGCSKDNDLITDTGPGRVAYLGFYEGDCNNIPIPDDVKCFVPNQKADTYPIKNFMSYGPIKCQNYFTPKQFLRMRDMYDWREKKVGPPPEKVFRRQT
jgi:hypothetical protein